MSGRLNATATTREASQGLSSRPSSANKTYQVASEPGDHIKLKRREISKNRQPTSSADLELLVDTRTPDSEDSRMGSLSLWEDFARSARAGMIDAVSVKGARNVSSEDVQEGLDKATERFIPLASKRSDQGSVSALTGNDPVKPTFTKASSSNQSPVPPTPTIADLIEFD